LVEELVEWVSVFPDHFEVTVSGARWKPGRSSGLGSRVGLATAARAGALRACPRTRCPEGSQRRQVWKCIICGVPAPWLHACRHGTSDGPRRG
jgi:hypothetical protein